MCLVLFPAQPDVQMQMVWEYNSPDQLLPDAAASDCLLSLKKQMGNLMYPRHQQHSAIIQNRFFIFLNKKKQHTPGAKAILSSESDSGSLCLFKLALPPFSSPASISSFPVCKDANQSQIDYFRLYYKSSQISKIGFINR